MHIWKDGYHKIDDVFASPDPETFENEKDIHLGNLSKKSLNQSCSAIVKIHFRFYPNANDISIYKNDLLVIKEQ